MIKEITIAGRKIGPDHPIFIIAEIGGNYETVAQAKKMIDHAKEAGADAVKLQTYLADKVAQPGSKFEVKGLGEVSQYDIVKRYEVDIESHKEIFNYIKQQGLIAF